MSAVDGSAGVAVRLFGDALLLVQLVCAALFGYSQFTTMLETTAGVSVTWIALWLAFLLVNLALAVGALRVHPDRVIRQTVAIYIAWTAACVANLGLLAVIGIDWTRIDTVTAVLTGAGVATAIVIGRRRGSGLSDPMVRAAFAVCFKAVPQLTLAWNIAVQGGAGIAFFTILSGHITITLRLLQVLLAIRQAGWDRHRTGLAIGEGANLLSWLVATVVWVLVG